MHSLLVLQKCIFERYKQVIFIYIYIDMCLINVICVELQKYTGANICIYIYTHRNMQARTTNEHNTPTYVHVDAYIARSMYRYVHIHVRCEGV